MRCLNITLCLLFLSFHGFSCSSQTSSSHTNNATAVVFNVGVVLDLDSVVGRVGQSCLSMALSDFYSLHPNYTTRLSLHVRDSKGQVLDAAAVALDLLEELEVDAIVGPQNSAQANFVMDLGNRSHVPIILFSARSPSMLSRTPYFIQTALGDDAQVGAISSIIKAFRWRQVTIIYEDTDYGNGLMPSLCTAFQYINAQIAYRSIIPLSATDDFILMELYKLMTMQTRVFVVHMSLYLGTQLFLKAKDIGMLSEGYVWIITDGLMDLIYYMGSPLIEAMQGVLGVKPWIPRSKELDSFEVRWRRKFCRENPAAKHAEISIFALWAYDTVWALAMAAEKVGVKEPVINLDNNLINVTNLFGLGISQTGPKLLRAMLETKFVGLSGEFDIVNGRLRPSAFQILNVIGKGEREVGIWTQSRGISRGFHTNETDSSLNLRESFRGIVWPGETTFVPKGWEIPVSGKKLRIAVPVKLGFTEFVKVEIDPLTNATKVSGISIDIFDAVMGALPYAVPYEYHPFENGDDSSAAEPGSYYNDMVYQVYLEPLNTHLWLTSTAVFILTGFSVWVLEHRINPAIRGPLSHHVGLILWFPLSGIEVTSNLARLVVAVWLFVALILSSSYTASLSSRLTVQRLQPTASDVNQLIRNGDYVGYPYGCFIADLLMVMGFEDSQLKAISTQEECDEALSKGSKNGGISAFFHSVPHVRLFLSEYCGKYMAIGPIYNTEGIGFAFPKGSPLVADVSRAVVTVMEGKKYADILQSKCIIPDSNSINSTSLTLQSFRGIFIFAGFVIVLCLLVYLAKYTYDNRDHLKIMISDSSTTTWSRLYAICKHWDQRDLSSYPFNREKDPEKDPENVLELNDVGDSSLSADTRLKNGFEMASTPSEEELDDATDESVDPNSEDMVVVHLPRAKVELLNGIVVYSNYSDTIRIRQQLRGELGICI
ncbi:hypothetical protein Vadar_007794 [Vaccinium darrowii]|uniref:Uncharacterized protein n=1 Tax=Vaccinium darrowii TaxID=229202 RepID=A0ACB7ZJA5_9ERIC|nr:hypothetical protein Vadar_007794 [Vaccinium darrowii]